MQGENGRAQQVVATTLVTTRRGREHLSLRKARANSRTTLTAPRAQFVMSSVEGSISWQTSQMPVLCAVRKCRSNARKHPPHRSPNPSGSGCAAAASRWSAICSTAKCIPMPSAWPPTRSFPSSHLSCCSTRCRLSVFHSSAMVDVVNEVVHYLSALDDEAGLDDQQP